LECLHNASSVKDLLKRAERAAGMSVGACTTGCAISCHFLATL
jgi:hypothetical protein